MNSNTKYLSVSFQNLIDGNNGESILKEKLAVFKCMDEEIENFIKNKSIDIEKKNIMRFHMLIDSSNNELLGIYSLSTQPLILKDTISNSRKEKLTGSRKKSEVPAVMVGVLAKCSNATNKISGQVIIKEIIRSVLELNDIAAIKILHLECKDLDCITSFYEENGMILLNDANNNPVIRVDEKMNYKTYLLSIDNMKRMI